MKRTLIILAASAAFAGCSTDIEVNAPHRNIHVMYGLLDQSQEIQYIKVNKAFLGAGDALVYAQIPDSSELAEGQVTHQVVNKIGSNGQVTATYPLRDTIIQHREPGVFYSTEQRMFYFREPQTYPLSGGLVGHLDQNSEYEIQMTVRGEELRGRTTVVNDISLGTGSVLSSPEISLFGATGYGEPPLRFNVTRNGRRYQLRYSFNYREETGGEQFERNIVRTIGTAVAASSQTPGTALTMVLNGEEFYRTLANALPPVDPTVTRRVFTGIDFIFTVANDDFHTYLTLTEPVSGIVQDRVEYSNVENGYGIFGSRYNKTYSRFLSGASLTELMTGQYTATRGFCYQRGNDAVQCP